jgi:hypothetical protein
MKGGILSECDIEARGGNVQNRFEDALTGDSGPGRFISVGIVIMLRCDNLDAAGMTIPADKLCQTSSPTLEFETAPP